MAKLFIFEVISEIVHDIDAFSFTQFKTCFLDTVKKYLGRTVFKGSVNVFGQRHGKGKCVWKKGTQEETVYEGDWRNGDCHGYGTLQSRRGGFLYRGSFLANKRKAGVQGWTEFKIASYRGEWADDKPHGVGIMVSTEDDKYAGEI